jgi:hypothetical protein
MYQTYESVTHPDPSKRAKINAAKAAYMTGVSSAAAAINIYMIQLLFDDDEAEEIFENMRERAEHERLGNAAIFGWFRMPFDYGLSGSLMSLAWNQTEEALLGTKGKPVRKDYEKRALALLKRSTNVPGYESLIPPHVAIVAEQLRNKSYFTDREIVPSYLLDRYSSNPQLQYFWDTPELYNDIGAGVGVSPLRVQHAVRGVFTSIVDDAVQAMDKYNKGRATWADFPMSKGLMTWEPRDTNSRSVQALMDLDDTHQSLKDAIKKDTRMSESQRDVMRQKLDKLSWASTTMKQVEKLRDDIRDERNSDQPDYDRIQTIERQIRDLASQFINDRRIDNSIMEKTFGAQIDRLMPYKPSGSHLYKSGKGAPTVPEKPPATATDAEKKEYQAQVKKYNQSVKQFKESQREAEAAIREIIGGKSIFGIESKKSLKAKLSTAMSGRSAPKPPPVNYVPRKGYSRADHIESWKSYHVARKEFLEFQQRASDIMERLSN